MHLIDYLANVARHWKVEMSDESNRRRNERRASVMYAVSNRTRRHLTTGASSPGDEPQAGSKHRLLPPGRRSSSGTSRELVCWHALRLWLIPGGERVRLRPRRGDDGPRGRP